MREQLQHSPIATIVDALQQLASVGRRVSALARTHRPTEDSTAHTLHTRLGYLSSGGRPWFGEPAVSPPGVVKSLVHDILHGVS